MPYYVVDKVACALGDMGTSVKSSRILLLGLAYKKDVDDTRESPSFKLIELLCGRGAHVDYNDPYCPRTLKKREYDFNMESVPLTAESLGSYDCVVISTDHSSYDYEFIVKNSRLVVDTRNATNGITGGAKVVKA